MHTDLLFLRVPASFFAGFFAPAGSAKNFFSGRTKKKIFFRTSVQSRGFLTAKTRESVHSRAFRTAKTRDSRCLHRQSARPNVRGLPSAKPRTFAGWSTATRECPEIWKFGRTVSFFLFFPPSSVRICHFGSGTISRSSS